tara:strand:+ start:110959 stop:111876 length:918 start_codon:yes stop_codon:yes gene_type:complete
MSSLAPIAIFAYNRPWHIQQTIESLKRDDLASQSDVFIFSDAAKNSEAAENVEMVRQYLRNISGFKSLKIVKREENWGLARSITEGITEVINEHGRIIVLEDDVVVSTAFLTFMNKALDYYQFHPNIWHISGYNYPMQLDTDEDAFFWRLMVCWGWATWEDRWSQLGSDADKIMSEFGRKDIFRFNMDGYEKYSGQVLDNLSGKMSTWAIFWYATIFRNNGLCLNPVRSYCNNIGDDGSGERGTNRGPIARRLMPELNTRKKNSFPTKEVELQQAVDAFGQCIKPASQKSFPRMVRYLKRKSFGG